MAELHILATAEGVAGAAAEYVASLSEDSVREHGRFTIALSGGSTPSPLYRKLALAPFLDRIDWSRWQVFWSDERCVPRDHSDSSYRAARDALLDHVPLPLKQVHRMPGELPPDEGAEQYEATLTEAFGTPFPSFDLVLLGVGEDGHTASLFPGSAALAESDRLVIAAVGRGQSHRLTFSLPLINAARSVAFLVTDGSKAETIREVHRPGATANPLPAAMVRPPAGSVHWFLTRAAAGQLEGTKV